MPSRTAPELIRAYFHAYETSDRDSIELLLTDDFTFTSPLDDKISRQAFFARCWPHSATHSNFDIERCTPAEGGAYVTYSVTRDDGAQFRNTEYFEIDGDTIRHVDVFFGRSNAKESNETAVRALIDKTVAAICAKDPEALLACYGPDVLAFDLLVPLQYSGTAALKERVSQWLGSFTGPVNYELHDLRITQG